MLKNDDVITNNPSPSSSTSTKRFLVSRVVQYPTADDGNQVEQPQYPELSQVEEVAQRQLKVVRRPRLVINSEQQKDAAATEEDVTFRYTWPVRITER